MNIDPDRPYQLDRDSRGTRYYRNAVERHWDPAAIELDRDRTALLSFLHETDRPEDHLHDLRLYIARFGAGEQAVTEDLAPLAVALEDINDTMFVTTQLYEEAKHTDYFDRYWRDVIHPVETELGFDRSSPTDSNWFNDAYLELFERNERAMARLFEEPTSVDFARAYCHYHLVIEGILAQTGYYGLQRSYAEDTHPELPSLPGLYEGFTYIRQDEGRHVGFGMAKLKHLVRTDAVDPALLQETVNSLLPLVDAIAADPNDQAVNDAGVGVDELREFASQKHEERMHQITAATATIPDLDTLTRLETVDEEP